MNWHENDYKLFQFKPTELLMIKVNPIDGNLQKRFRATIIIIFSGSRPSSVWTTSSLARGHSGRQPLVLTSCISVWFGCCTTSNQKTLQDRVNTACKIIGVSLSSLLVIHNTPRLLTSGLRFRSLQDHTTRPLKTCNWNTSKVQT